MRDFRDAKTMAQSLKKALAAHAVTQTHSQCLELIAQAFGLENWNTLSAKIDEARLAEPRPTPAATGTKTIYCTFCGKSQQEVKLLIAGPPPAAICDECVGLCDNIVFDNRLGKEIAEARAREPDADPGLVALGTLRRFTDEQLRTYRRANADWEEHIVWGLEQIAARLEGRSATPWRPDERAEARGWTRDPLEGKTQGEIVAHRAHLEGLLGPIRERTKLVETLFAERGLAN